AVQSFPTRRSSDLGLEPDGLGHLRLALRRRGGHCRRRPRRLGRAVPEGCTARFLGHPLTPCAGKGPAPTRGSPMTTIDRSAAYTREVNRVATTILLTLAPAVALTVAVALLSDGAATVLPLAVSALLFGAMFVSNTAGQSGPTPLTLTGPASVALAPPSVYSSPLAPGPTFLGATRRPRPA